MGRNSKETFTASQISDWLDVPRSTLFRWEDEGLVNPSERSGGGLRERLYNAGHLSQVGGYARTRFFHERDLRIRRQLKWEEACPIWTPEEMETHALIWLYSNPDDPSVARQFMYEAALTHPFGERVVAHLIDFATSFPRRHPVRAVVWSTLSTNEQVFMN